MLTNRCYVNIDPAWDTKAPDGKKTIQKCCGQPDPNDPGGDCCYDSWQVQLQDVNQRYKAATEEADQMKKRLTVVTDRRNRFRMWVTELDKAEDYSRLICNHLDIIVSQSRRILYASSKTVKAIEILYCMIIDFYFQVDGLRKQFEYLTNCANNNHDPAVGKGTGILKYADEYSQKLDAVIKTKDDIILAALEAIRIANLIRSSISTKKWTSPVPPDTKPPADFNPCSRPDKICPDCCDDKSRYYGFKAVICEWYQEFNCDVKCLDPTTGNSTNDSQGQQGQTSKPPEKPKENCDESQEPKQPEEKCKLKPSFEFPICNDKYKKDLQTWLLNDEKTVRDLADFLKESQKKKESLQACKDSLTKAIAEVDPRTRCK